MQLPAELIPFDQDHIREALREKYLVLPLDQQLLDLFLASTYYQYLSENFFGAIDKEYLRLKEDADQIAQKIREKKDKQENFEQEEKELNITHSKMRCLQQLKSALKKDFSESIFVAIDTVAHEAVRYSEKNRTMPFTISDLTKAPEGELDLFTKVLQRVHKGHEKHEGFNKAAQRKINESLELFDVRRSPWRDFLKELLGMLIVAATFFPTGGLSFGLLFIRKFQTTFFQSKTKTNVSAMAEQLQSQDLKEAKRMTDKDYALALTHGLSPEHMEISDLKTLVDLWIKDILEKKRGYEKSPQKETKDAYLKTASDTYQRYQPYISELVKRLNGSDAQLTSNVSTIHRWLDQQKDEIDRLRAKPSNSSSEASNGFVDIKLD